MRDCPGVPVRIVSLTNNNPWDKTRRFPNLSEHGDGTKAFDSRAEYEQHLKDNDWAEVTDVPKSQRLGHKQVFTDRKSVIRRPTPGPW